MGRWCATFLLPPNQCSGLSKQRVLSWFCGLPGITEMVLTWLQLNASWVWSRRKACWGWTSKTASSYAVAGLSWPGKSPSLHVASFLTTWWSHTRGTSSMAADFSQSEHSRYPCGYCKASRSLLTKAWNSCDITSTIFCVSKVSHKTSPDSRRGVYTKLWLTKGVAYIWSLRIPDGKRWIVQSSSF